VKSGPIDHAEAREEPVSRGGAERMRRSFAVRSGKAREPSMGRFAGGCPQAQMGGWPALAFSSSGLA